MVSFAYGEDLYNMTALDNTNNIFEYIILLNTLSNYNIGYALILIIFSVVFSVQMSNTGNILGGAAAAAFFTMLSATIFLPLTIIDWTAYQIVFILGVFIIIFSFWFGVKGGGG